MVSEEIDLNHALEADGIEIKETDLGEYIVQLRGERPGHILTPAVHLRRGEVGQTFTEKLGVPYTEDVVTLTQVARKMLREKFLSADIGVSGVNFGVVENGLICVLTNEGNGRMCTTVPPVHIALMGMERLVASMDDLVKVLKVLPRASTGQKLTVYTNLILGPRKDDEPDGPEERHLIILDNGRSRLRKGPLAEALNCVRCGACLNVCPVFREIGGHAYVGEEGQVSVYSGPIGSVIAPGFFGVENFGNLARASSLCGACRDACPVGIDLPNLLLRVRAEEENNNQDSPTHIPWRSSIGIKIFSWFAFSSRRFHAAQKLAGLFGGLFANSANWIRLPAFTGWGYAKDFPNPARKPFRELISAKQQQTQHPLRPSPKIQQLESVPDNQTFSIDVVNLVDQFQIESESLGVEFYRCTEKDLNQKILEFIRAENVEKIWSWDEKQFPIDLVNMLAAQGIEIVSSGQPMEDLAQVKIGLTGVFAAVAETGSLALPGGNGRPLLTSLLPEIHIAVVSENQIVKSLEELFAVPGLMDSSAGALISGPSRTGDIELTLTVGVHGPKRVVVFCVKK